MKKLKLLAILAICLLPGVAWGATYYACIAGNIDAANAWEDAVGCDGTTFTYGTGGFPASGSILDANALAMVINTDPGPNGKVTLKNGAVSAAAGYSYATASNLTMNMDLDGTGASGQHLLLITGSTGGGTIVGNITSGAESARYAVSDTHTLVTIAITGNITGGGHINTTGYLWNGATGSVTVSGTVLGATGPGFTAANAGTATIANCTGSSVGQFGYGCAGTSTGSITVTGNIINGTRNMGVYGTIIYAPAAATNYVAFLGGTDIYLSVPPAANKILTSGSYVDSTDGTYDAGTATSGGGAWAN